MTCYKSNNEDGQVFSNKNLHPTLLCTASEILPLESNTSHLYIQSIFYLFWLIKSQTVNHSPSGFFSVRMWIKSNYFFPENTAQIWWKINLSSAKHFCSVLNTRKRDSQNTLIVDSQIRSRNIACITSSTISLLSGAYGWFSFPCRMSYFSPSFSLKIRT